MSALSYGLNVTKKSGLGRQLPAVKRKTIFDDGSDPEEEPDDSADSYDNVAIVGSSQHSNRKSSQVRSKLTGPPSRIAKTSTIPLYGDLSSNHSAAKNSKNAQEIDPSIYDYDGVYESLHAPPAGTSETVKADREKRPKYMGNLLAAAEVRKRDQLRAKEKMLAKEREAEGDEFADKEKFVTGAYKRQQVEMRRLEEEEAAKEREAEERKRREGGGMKALYKHLLDRDEEKHQSVMEAVAKNESRSNVAESADAIEKDKSDAELAKEKGAMVNEDGQVVDKRQLLSAGLNAAAAPKAKAVPLNSVSRKRAKESTRERETRMFEDQLLGKHAASSDEDDDEDNRAAKSRKLEDELLGLGTP